MTAFDESLALEHTGEGQWRARADPAREANTGMFGGWTAALLAKAALNDPRASGSLSAITTNFISRVPPGSALSLRSAPLGGGKSMTHWRCELLVDGVEGVAAAAHIVLTNRRESDRFTEDKIPEAPPPEVFPLSTRRGRSARRCTCTSPLAPICSTDRQRVRFAGSAKRAANRWTRCCLSI